MVFPATPKTWVTAALVTAAQLNAELRDAVRYLKGMDGDVELDDDLDLLNHYLKNIGAVSEQGDIIYHDGVGFRSLVHGTAGQSLISGGHGGNPSWSSGLAYKMIWATPHQVSGAGAVLGSNFGHYTGALMENGQLDQLWITFAVPSHFNAIVKAVLMVMSGGTGNMYAQFQSYFAANGQAYNTHSDSLAYTTYAISAGIIKEIDITDLFTGLAADDYVGVNFARNAANASDTCEASIIVTGIQLVYS